MAASAASAFPSVNQAILRPMAPTDLPAVRALELCLFDDPWSDQALGTFLQRPVLALVAERGDLAGYLLCSQGGGEADLLRIAVVPEQRRQGLAAALLRRLQRELSGKGVASLFLEVRASNGGAIACYHALGFAALGVRKKYYSGPDGGEDALLMRWPSAGDAG